jgi:hypothetical protein
MKSAVAVSGKRPGDTACAGIIEISHGDREPIACKRVGSRLANAARGPGYDCNAPHLPTPITGTQHSFILFSAKDLRAIAGAISGSTFPFIGMRTLPACF